MSNECSPFSIGCCLIVISINTKKTILTPPMTKARGFSGGSRKSISGIRSSPEIRVCHHPSQDSAYSILGWQTIALSYTVCHRPSPQRLKSWLSAKFYVNIASCILYFVLFVIVTFYFI